MKQANEQEKVTDRIPESLTRDNKGISHETLDLENLTEIYKNTIAVQVSNDKHQEKFLNDSQANKVNNDMVSYSEKNFFRQGEEVGSHQQNSIKDDASYYNKITNCSSQLAKGVWDESHLNNYNENAEMIDNVLKQKTDKLKKSFQKKQEEKENTHQEEITKLREMLEKEKTEKSRMKETHRKEVRALSKQKDDIIKKYTEQKQGEPSKLEENTSSAPRRKRSSTTKKNTAYASLSLSSSDDEEEIADKPHQSLVVFNREDSILNTLDIRFVEGMTKFIEGKNVGTELFCSYPEWHMAIIKEMERDRVYQIRRHIFLMRSYDEVFTADDRKLSFSSKEPRRLSFGKKKCEFDDFSEDGWPMEIDHMLVLHPSERKIKEIHRSKRNLQGKEYFEWSTNWIDDEFYHKTTDQFENKCFTLLLCAYVEEKNFKDARVLKTCPTCGSKYYDNDNKS